MRYFASIDDDGVVTNVTNVDDSVENPIEFLSDLVGGNWVETFVDDPEIECASIGGLYIAERQAFTSKQPYESWTLSDESLQWEPPKPMPASIGPWGWNENTRSWEKAE